MPKLLKWFVDLAKEIDRGMSLMRGGEPEKKVSREAEVRVTDSGVLIRMNLSGVAPEDVDLTISNRGVLTVSGILRPVSADEKVFSLEDLDFDGFREVVNLPTGYENGEARATFNGEVLEIAVEKSESEEGIRQFRIENG